MLFSSFFFFFNDTATTEIYTLSLHDALPISEAGGAAQTCASGECGDRGESNGRVSVFHAWRVEIAWAHAGRDVSSGSRRLEPVVHWGSCAIHAGLCGAICGVGEEMGVIEVQAPGLLTTVQDLGREGFGPLGVSPSGAADAVALRIGNRLVGNEEGAAGLEMTLH